MLKKISFALGHMLFSVLIIFLCLALFLNISTLISLNKIKQGGIAQTGYASAIVSSGSMYPTLAVNDFVVIKGHSFYNNGDVITLVTEHGDLLTHRITTVLPEGYITQGDANNIPDDIVRPQQIMGRVILSLPGIGFLINALTTPIGILFVLSVPACILLIRYLIAKA